MWGWVRIVTVNNAHTLVFSESVLLGWLLHAPPTPLPDSYQLKENNKKHKNSPVQDNDNKSAYYGDHKQSIQRVNTLVLRGRRVCKNRE